MRTVLLVCLLATALAQTGMAPVHMIEPVYDNTRPSGPQQELSPCSGCGTGSPCGSGCGGLSSPIGTNVVIDDDVNAAPQWNSTPSSSKFVTFDSAQNEPTPGSPKAFKRRALIWKFGNLTVRLATEVSALRQSIRGIALRVDAHKGRITALLANATAAREKLLGAVNKLSGKIQIAFSRGKINQAHVSRLEEALGKLRKRLDRCQKAIDFIRSAPRSKAPLPANAPATTVPRNPSPASARAPVAPAVRVVVAKETKKAVLRVETIDLARQIDDLQNLTMSTARNVDKNKTGVTRLTEVIRRRVREISTQIRAESARVNSSFANKLITPARQQKEMRALDLLRNKLRKVGNALRIITADNTKLKRRIAVQRAANSTAAKLQRHIVRVAASIDRARRRLANIKKLSPRNPKFMELVGVAEARLMSQAKNIDKFLAKVRRLQASGALPKLRADRMIRAISIMRTHIKNLAVQVAAQKRRAVPRKAKKRRV